MFYSVYMVRAILVIPPEKHARMGLEDESSIRTHDLLPILTVSAGADQTWVIESRATRTEYPGGTMASEQCHCFISGHEDQVQVSLLVHCCDIAASRSPHILTYAYSSPKGR